VVTSIHQWSFADQAAVLDGKTGKVLSEYWHRGHLLHMVSVDLDRNGHPAILLGGVNDAPEYAQATVVIFDESKIEGGSRDPGGHPYFQGVGSGGERQAIYFPRTAISRDKEFNRVSNIKAAAGRITVIVSEGTHEEADPTVIYEFNDMLQVVNVMLSDQVLEAYSALQRSGKLATESANVICERLKRQVRIVTPS